MDTNISLFDLKFLLKKSLAELIKKYSYHLKEEIYFAENVLETLEECGTVKIIPPELIFHSTHDAVMVLTHPDPAIATDNSCTRL